MLAGWFSAAALALTAPRLAQEITSPAGDTNAPARLALLVGIGDYPPEAGFEDLGGPVRDTEALRDVLVDRFGFRSEDVLLLHDAAATHAGIVRAFAEHLLRRAGPTTEAVFFFSGHGSRVPDASGEEPDGFDTTYVAFDSRSEDHRGARDLCDDELFSLVSALCARTPRVTVIADSCHAGGGLRARPEGRPKAVTPGAEPLDREWLLRSFWPEDVPLLEDDAPRIPSERHLHVAACRRDQVAFEVPVPGPEGGLLSRGLLSLFLVQALEGAQPGDTWDSVLRDCQLAVTGVNSAQSVVVEGALERVLFGDGFRRREGFASTLLAGGGSIRIDLSVPHGLRLGSRLEVRSRDRRIGEVEVDAVNAAFARGRWVGAAPADIQAAGLRAVESSPPGGLPPLRVRCAEEQRALLGEVSSGLIELVPEGAPADVELVLEAGFLRLRTPEGIPLLDPLAADDAARAVQIASALREELRWRFLFDLGREPSRLPVRAKFRIPTREEIDERRSAWNAHEHGYVPASARGSARERAAGGEILVGGIPPDAESARPVVLLELENPHSTALHVAVLSVSEDRGRCLMGFEGKDGRTLELPPKGRASVPCAIVIPPSWPLERPMRDRYLVLSMPGPFDPRGYESRATLRAEERQEDAGLPPALCLDTLRGAGDPSRSGDKPPKGGGDSAAKAESSRTAYGVVAVDLLVEGP